MHRGRHRSRSRRPPACRRGPRWRRSRSLSARTETAEAADRGVERLRTAFERGVRVGEARVARVVAVEAPGSSALLDEAGDLLGRGDSDRVR